MRLRTYLISMAVAILVPVIAFSALALNMLQNAERDAALRSLHETAYGLSLLVDRELYSAEAALHVLAASPYLADGNMAAFYEQAKTANRGPDGWTFLLDENGQQIFNTIVPFGTKMPPAVAGARVQKVLATNRTLVSDVVSGPVTKRLVTTLNVPVYLQNGKRYVLALAFSTDHFNRLIIGAHVPSQWLVGLMDGGGHFIARSMNKEELVGKSARPELVEMARQEDSGELRHRTLEGTEVYDVFTHSSLSGWMVAIAAPVVLVEQSARHAALVAALGMLAAIACAGGAAFLFSAMLVRSIKRAAGAAMELGHGKLPQEARSRVIEVNELHSALREAGNLLSQAQAYRKTAESGRQALLHSEQQARQAAEEQNKAKDQFLAMLGHELRNPLAPISTAAQLLKLPGLDENRVHYVSGVISRQVEHMNSLVNDLLDVSRVTRGLVTLGREPVDMEKIVSGAAEQVRPLIESRHQNLTIRLPADPLWVFGDKTRLVQILTNLLANAAKYTQEGGDITVALSSQAEWIELIVRDNGPGIGRDLLPRVFELFSQGDRTPDRPQGGLGLGLALVKSLVELHGGSVSAYSEGTAKGSAFTVRLPRLATPQPVMEGRQESLAPAGQSMRVMIVDDNIDAAESLALFLRNINAYQVSVHYDGKSALEWAVQEDPRVFILDIGLPDIDGYELARRLRAMPQVGNAILIALTGYGQAQDRERAKAAGFDYHLSKPADPLQLSAFLTEISMR